jgi:uncharacterized iron-regulated membrane protein
VWLRKAIFQIHMWSGIGLGLYVLVVSVTGSIVVYSNELYRAATPKPVLVLQSGPRLTDDELGAAATRAYPGYRVISITGGQKPDQAVSISLIGTAGRKNRLFNPYEVSCSTGAWGGDALYGTSTACSVSGCLASFCCSH